MAWTTPSTWVAGNVLTAAQLNQQLRDNTKFLHGPPMVKVSRDAALTIAASAWEEITFDTEAKDTNTMWSSTAATKVFAQTAGDYLVIGHGGLAASTVGVVRAIGIRHNSTSGAPVARSGFIGDLPTSFTPDLHISDIITMTTGQYVQLVFFQDSGGTLAITTAADTQPKLRMIWVSS